MRNEGRKSKKSQLVRSKPGRCGIFRLGCVLLVPRLLLWMSHCDTLLTFVPCVDRSPAVCKARDR